jgi:hypothetical protein
MIDARALLSTFLVAIGLFIGSSPAWADKIDGEWCARDGKRLSIAGSEITTPGGARITGHYSRHHFSYVVPKPEPDAGETVEMSLRSEEEVWIVPRPNAPLEVWHRCPASV